MTQTVSEAMTHGLLSDMTKFDHESGVTQIFPLADAGANNRFLAVLMIYEELELVSTRPPKDISHSCLFEGSPVLSSGRHRRLQCINAANKFVLHT